MAMNKEAIAERIAGLEAGAAQLQEAITKGEAQLSQLRLDLVATRAAIDENRNWLTQIGEPTTVVPLKGVQTS